MFHQHDDLTCHQNMVLSDITADIIRRPAELAALHVSSVCRLHYDGRGEPGKFWKTLCRVWKHLEMKEGTNQRARC